VAVEFVLNEPVLMLNVPVEAPAATVTDAGIVNALALPVRVTEAPPAGAFALSVTVQVAEALGPRLAGLQLNDETPVVATRFTVAVLVLPP
jgi:hypothetical protein